MTPWVLDYCSLLFLYLESRKRFFITLYFDLESNKLQISAADEMWIKAEVISHWAPAGSALESFGHVVMRLLFEVEQWRCQWFCRY